MNWKRKTSKKHVRCTMCTQHRWKGNMKGPDGRFSIQENRLRNIPADLSDYYELKELYKENGYDF